MQNVVRKYGGLVLFYLFIILCVVIVNARFEYLNSEDINEILVIND